MADHVAANRAHWDDRVPMRQPVGGAAAALLRPGGRLYLHDRHPLAWALDDEGLRLASTQEHRSAKPEDRRQGIIDSPQLLPAQVTRQISESSGIHRSDLLDEDTGRFAIDLDLGTKRSGKSAR
jgi:hypothetical protein